MKKIIALILAAAALAAAAVPAAAESSYTPAEYEWSFIKKIPMKPKYTEEVENKGTVECITYTTHSYALEAVASGEEVLKAPDDNDEILPIDAEALCGDQTEFVMEKELYVYLPYGYDPSVKYNVVYALHGTEGGADYWIGDNTMGLTTRKMLDRMIDSGECAPFILVTPSYYSIPEDKAELAEFSDFYTEPLCDVWPMYFWTELENDIMPLIESRYSVYTDADEDARDHRGFVGLSRGSMTTVNSVMMHCLQDFSYFGTFSGIWCDFDAFKARLESDEYKDLDVKFWYSGNGSADFSLENHEAFRDRALTEMSDRFTDGGNFAWVSFKGGAHAYNCWLPDLYNAMLVFFTK